MFSQNLETHIWVRVLADHSTVAYYGLWLFRRLVQHPLRMKLLWRRWLCNNRWREKRSQEWCYREKFNHPHFSCGWQAGATERSRARGSKVISVWRRPCPPNQ